MEQMEPPHSDDPHEPGSRESSSGLGLMLIAWVFGLINAIYALVELFGRALSDGSHSPTLPLIFPGTITIITLPLIPYLSVIAYFKRKPLTFIGILPFIPPLLLGLPSLLLLYSSMMGSAAAVLISIILFFAIFLTEVLTSKEGKRGIGLDILLTVSIISFPVVIGLEGFDFGQSKAHRKKEHEAEAYLAERRTIIGILFTHTKTILPERIGPYRRTIIARIGEQGSTSEPPSEDTGFKPNDIWATYEDSRVKLLDPGTLTKRFNLHTREARVQLEKVKKEYDSIKGQDKPNGWSPERSKRLDELGRLRGSLEIQTKWNQAQYQKREIMANQVRIYLFFYFPGDPVPSGMIHGDGTKPGVLESFGSDFVMPWIQSPERGKEYPELDLERACVLGQTHPSAQGHTFAFRTLGIEISVMARDAVRADTFL